ncbi:radical SAM protein [Streptomyces sp. V4-01]|uniref:Radical SAM protein n=1 Tax=Actinacidiphila polyblastidii TaxID=3110430 RepID=A0ABU7PLM5_9ACTN|nr:radical SAM protein [Streptomyces sp. V4-01]
MTSEQHPEHMFRRFAGTFTADEHPDLVLMSGGEVMLRPELVKDIANTARAVGARSYALSGMFFARKPRIAAPIRAAIDALDHFSASLDVFHEEEVSRAQVFRVLHELIDDGKDVSIQLTGLGADDPYLADITTAVRREFDDRVPMLVAPLAPTGRAEQWLTRPAAAAHPHPQTTLPAPCWLSAWPVIGFDGQVTSCGNQDVMDGKVPLPPHLYLGHIRTDDWATIKERCLASPMVRAVRTYGPYYLAERFGDELACDGYCQTCWKLSGDAATPARIKEFELLPATRAVEDTALRMARQAGPLSFARRFGITRYADLVSLGYSATREVAWSD